MISGDSEGALVHSEALFGAATETKCTMGPEFRSIASGSADDIIP